MLQKSNSQVIIFFLLFLTLSLTSCATLNLPPLKEIYEPYKGTAVNPVIFIPGIKGSELLNTKTGHTVWGGVWQFFPSDFDDLKLDKIKFTDDDFEVFNQESDVTASAVFKKFGYFYIFKMQANFDIYESLYTTFSEVGGYIDSEVKITYDSRGILSDVTLGRNIDNDKQRAIFSFYYDWRRDNVLNAVNLSKFIEKIKKDHYADQPDVKFDIIAHSMGGLITRFYIGYRGFCNHAADNPSLIYKSINKEEPEEKVEKIYKNIGKVILLATPSGGSMAILGAFLNGTHMETLSKEKVKRHIVTMPSVYQLLPQCCMQAKDATLRCFEPLENDASAKNLLEQIDKNSCAKDKYSMFDDKTWRDMKWSVFSNEWEQDELKDQRRKLLAKGLARAAEFTQALKRADKKPAMQNVLIIMGGDCDKTLERGLVFERTKETIKDGLVLEETPKTVKYVEQEKEIVTLLDKSEIESHLNYLEMKYNSMVYFKPGDGLVLRKESMLNFHPSRASFVCKSHGYVFKDETLQDNLLYELLINKK